MKVALSVMERSGIGFGPKRFHDLDSCQFVCLCFSLYQVSLAGSG
jgi:hypothetical protein